MRTMLSDTAKKSYTESEKNTRSMLLERLGGIYRNARTYTERSRHSGSFLSWIPALVRGRRSKSSTPGGRLKT